MPAGSADTNSNNDVPVRTILATIGLVVATYLMWLFIQRAWTIIELILIAAFFALTLNPAVDFLQTRLRLRRGWATAIVFLVGVGILAGLLYVFIRPIVDQTQTFIDGFPQFFEDASNGRGTVGQLVERYNLDQYVSENQERLRTALTSSTASAINVAGLVFSTAASFITVIVLTILMLLEGPQMLRAPLIFFDQRTQLRIRRVAADASRSVTGYMAGNLLISFIAGLVTYVSLRLLGVPFALVLAVWVACMDMIPLVGATLGAIASVGVSFLHNVRAGVIALIIYVVYQQIENQLLQTTIMAKTVRLNPLTVLVSVLLGVSIAGLLGALLAIPLAGVIQVVGRDLLDHNRGRLKGEPTIGPEETPVSQT